MNVVMIVIVPIIGNMKELAAPTSIPPFATTNAISPPDEDNPTAVRLEDNLLTPCILEER